ncbi:alpha/beta hydrolase [Roseomonas sp. BN140053]|uniref:alpha/beta hydrolase n=1 Tax=Roseomonas sp. BN140053 TaxID=3391898 RepID=UPI0039E90E4E
MSEVLRRDDTVRTVDGVNIAIREVMPAGGIRDGAVPLVLLHGTRIPGLSEYDLPVAGGSLVEDLGRAGHASVILDARGFGRSDRPALMERPPGESRPYARCMEILRDVDAAVAATPTAPGGRVALMGWGIGATVMLNYAALWPEKVSHLILYNVLYGGGTAHGRYKGHPLEDPQHPGRFNVAHYGGYSFNSPEMLMRKWEESIPVADKDAWRDPAVAQAFAQALLDGDPTAMDRDPPSYRSPNGMLEDSFYIGKGRKLVDACLVQAKVLIMRPGLDYFSRPDDIAALRADLVNAERVELWEPPDATHFVILDRPERGRAEAIATITRFLDS